LRSSVGEINVAREKIWIVPLSEMTANEVSGFSGGEDADRGGPGGEKAME
jgi:hypothetical protein